jgi:ATP-dependent exoDNAse (exonuclease V) alpha subunit
LGTKDFPIDSEKLSIEQAAAVRHVLTSRDRVIGIRGAAGTGKTTMMKEAVRCVEANGRKVFVFAPSASASRGILRQEGFTQADTLAQLLVNTRMQEQIKRQVVWVDEAGLISARQMCRLFELAEKLEARVILSGDIHQHGAVERGDALRLLEKYGGLKSAELTSIHRQKSQLYKEAVQALDAGNTQLAFKRLDDMNAIREVSDEKRYHCLAEDYLNHCRRKQSVLVVSPTHAEGEQVTEAIRTKLKADRLLSKEQVIGSLRNLNWTEAQRGEFYHYQPQQVIQFHQNVTGFRKGEKVTVLARAENTVSVRDEAGNARTLDLQHTRHFQVFAPQTVEIGRGDRVRFSQNGFTVDKKHRLQNGDIRRVKGFTRSGDIRLDNGWVVSRSYGHIQHGYAVTSHASQGKTVDHVLVAINAHSAMTTGSSEQAYVSVSRGRKSVTIYTDSQEAVLEAARISSARPSGHDLAAKLPVGKISRARIKAAIQNQQAAIRETIRQEQPKQSKQQKPPNKQVRITSLHRQPTLNLNRGIHL